MSTNPKSQMNFRPLALDDGGGGGLGAAEGRALTRSSRSSTALAASTDFTQEERELAAKAMQRRADR